MPGFFRHPIMQNPCPEGFLKQVRLTAVLINYYSFLIGISSS